MKQNPRISQYMTPAPRTIGCEQTLEQASDYMKKLHVHHLPVTKSGKPVGIITYPDIKLALRVANLNALNMNVESVLTPDPFFTTPDGLISDVIVQMTDEKFGCILVMEFKKLVGIFTTADALHAFSDCFKQENLRLQREF